MSVPILLATLTPESLPQQLNYPGKNKPWEILLILRRTIYQLLGME